VPKCLRNLIINRNILNRLELKCGNKDPDSLSSKSKNFYAFLIQEIAKHPRGFYTLMSDFNLTEEETRTVFVLVKSVALETLAQCFQFKILNNILFLNTWSLAKIRRIQSDLCQTFWETYEHFFYQYFGLCKFENFWLTVTRQQIKLEYINIILGILDQRSNLPNYFIILGKIYSWIAAKTNKSLSFCLSNMWSRENIKLKS